MAPTSGPRSESTHTPSSRCRARSTARSTLDQAARAFASGLEQNPFAAIREGKLELRRRDALEVPDAVREVRRVIETHLPRIRIEDLLVEVDRWCGFTRELIPLRGYQRKADRPYVSLLAALVAHGTNLGIATMAQSTDDLTVDVLHDVSKWFLRTDTLKAANRVLVDYHHRLPLSAAWGDGTASSSDGRGDCRRPRHRFVLATGRRQPGARAPRWRRADGRGLVLEPGLEIAADSTPIYYRTPDTSGVMPLWRRGPSVVSAS